MVLDFEFLTTLDKLNLADRSVESKSENLCLNNVKFGVLILIGLSNMESGLMLFNSLGGKNSCNMARLMGYNVVISCDVVHLSKRGGIWIFPALRVH